MEKVYVVLINGDFLPMIFVTEEKAIEEGTKVLKGDNVCVRSYNYYADDAIEGGIQPRTFTEFAMEIGALVVSDVPFIS